MSWTSMASAQARPMPAQAAEMTGRPRRGVRFRHPPVPDVGLRRLYSREMRRIGAAFLLVLLACGDEARPGVVWSLDATADALRRQGGAIRLLAAYGAPPDIRYAAVVDPGGARQEIVWEVGAGEVSDALAGWRAREVYPVLVAAV